MQLLMLIPYLGLILTWQHLGRQSMAAATLFTASALVLVLYLAGLAGLLQAAVVATVLTGVLGFAFFVWRHRGAQAPPRTWLPLGILLALCLIFHLLHAGAPFISYDEFAHWGIHIKHLWLTGAFWGPETNSMHPRYPPGVTLWQYWFTAFTGQTEGAVYFAHFVLFISPLLVLFEDLEKHVAVWLALVLALLIYLVTTLSLGLTSLDADHVISAWFAAVVLTYLRAIRTEDTRHPWIFCLPVGTMTLFKSSGLLLGGFAVAVMLLVTLTAAKNRAGGWRRGLGRAVTLGTACLTLVLALQYSWVRDSEARGVPPELHSNVGLIQGVVGGASTVAAEDRQTITSRYRELLIGQQLARGRAARDYSGFSWYARAAYDDASRLSVVGLYVVCVLLQGMSLLTISVGRVRRAWLATFIAMDLFAWIYFYVLYLTYQFAFDERALLLSSYIRYAQGMMFPLLLLSLAPMLPAFGGPAERAFAIGPVRMERRFALMTAILAALFAVERPYLKGLAVQLDTDVRKNTYQTRMQSREQLSRYPELSGTARVWVYVHGLDETGIDYRILFYELTPARVTLNNDPEILAGDDTVLEQVWGGQDYLLIARLPPPDVPLNGRLAAALRVSRVLQLRREGGKLDLVPVQPMGSGTVGSSR